MLDGRGDLVTISLVKIGTGRLLKYLTEQLQPMFSLPLFSLFHFIGLRTTSPSWLAGWPGREGGWGPAEERVGMGKGGDNGYFDYFNSLCGIPTVHFIC